VAGSYIKGMGTIHKDVPLSECTLRRYEKPINTDRDLVRRLCLTLGILQPGDSRDVIVDVLHVLLTARSQKKMMDTDLIRDLVIANRADYELEMNGIAHSNIRRQLRRLKELYLIECINNEYRISEFMSCEEVLNEKIMPFLIKPILQRVKEYLKAVDQQFK